MPHFNPKRCRSAKALQLFCANLRKRDKNFVCDNKIKRKIDFDDAEKR
jgi:hypothetical protein